MRAKNLSFPIYSSRNEVRGLKIPSGAGLRAGFPNYFPIAFSERARELLVSYEEEQFKVRMCP